MPVAIIWCRQVHGDGEVSPLIDDSAAVHVGAVFDAATATLSAEDAALPQAVVVVLSSSLSLSLLLIMEV